ncbi:TldD/PmbA family protein [Candidatus Thorarchaeota archaeon]|nr:MAG: TldD/PmbA family protein [Candidatus Thorarchaeota archaeon]
MDYVDMARKTVALAEKEGASQADAYAVRVRTHGVYIDDGVPKIGTTLTEIGVGIRYVLGKRIGFTSSTLTTESVEEVVLRAKKMAEVSDEDPKFVSLPEPKKVSGNPERFFSEETSSASGDMLIDKAVELTQAATTKEVSVPNGTLRASTQEFHIANSLGVDAGSKSTIVFGFFTAKSERNGGVGEGVQRCWSRDLGSIDFSAMGSKLKSQSLSVLKAKPFKDKWEDVVAVIVPSEGSELLGSLVNTASSGEIVNRKSSPWTDKIGDRVASESLTVFDNGLSERGLSSALVDDEGTPMQKKTVISEGILESYLYDSYNAGQVDLESTGNGLRRTPREPHGTFANSVSCASTTLEVPPSSKSVDDVIGEVDRGVYIEHFAWPIVDAMSGSFSNEVRNARLIENGGLTDQIKYALWVGNLYDSIKGNLFVANDTEVHNRRVMPTIAFPGTELIGQ